MLYIHGAGESHGITVIKLTNMSFILNKKSFNQNTVFVGYGILSKTHIPKFCVHTA